MKLGLKRSVYENFTRVKLQLRRGICGQFEKALQGTVASTCRHHVTA
jgi:hypothetical protein